LIIAGLVYSVDNGTIELEYIKWID
jgi:hypothetical protein